MVGLPERRAPGREPAGGQVFDLASPRRRWVFMALGVTLVVLAAFTLVATGMVGVGRPGRGLAASNFDMAFLYAAGVCWRAGTSPYRLEAFLAAAQSVGTVNEGGFAYPPQSSTLCFLLSAFTVNGAKRVLWTVNLLA